MYQILKKTETTVNRCSAMETRNHSKNGVSPKDQMSRENFLASVKRADNAEFEKQEKKIIIQSHLLKIRVSKESNIKK